MDQEQRRAAKAQLVTGMQAGQSWQTAAAQAGLPISQRQGREKQMDMIFLHV